MKKTHLLINKPLSAIFTFAVFVSISGCATSQEQGYISEYNHHEGQRYHHQAMPHHNHNYSQRHNGYYNNGHYHNSHHNNGMDRYDDIEDRIKNESRYPSIRRQAIRKVESMGYQVHEIDIDDSDGRAVFEIDALRSGQEYEIKLSYPSLKVINVEKD